jgi:hypothetical protein
MTRKRAASLPRVGRTGGSLTWPAPVPAVRRLYSRGDGRESTLQTEQCALLLVSAWKDRRRLAVPRADLSPTESELIPARRFHHFVGSRDHAWRWDMALRTQVSRRMQPTEYQVHPSARRQQALFPVRTLGVPQEGVPCRSNSDHPRSRCRRPRTDDGRNGRGGGSGSGLSSCPCPVRSQDVTLVVLFIDFARPRSDEQPVHRGRLFRFVTRSVLVGLAALPSVQSTPASLRRGVPRCPATSTPARSGVRPTASRC